MLDEYESNLGIIMIWQASLDELVNEVYNCHKLFTGTQKSKHEKFSSR